MGFRGDHDFLHLSVCPGRRGRQPCWAQVGFAIYLYANRFYVACRTLPNRICRPSYTTMRQLTLVLGEAGPPRCPVPLPCSPGAEGA